MPAILTSERLVVGAALVGGGHERRREAHQMHDRVGALTLADYFEARHGDDSRVLRLTATVIILFFFIMVFCFLIQ